jgi:hypothetical protein
MLRDSFSGIRQSKIALQKPLLTFVNWPDGYSVASVTKAGRTRQTVILLIVPSIKGN